MRKMRLDLDGLTVESFEPSDDPSGIGTVAAFEGSCSMQKTCGVASRGEETFDVFPATRYVCCV